MSQFLYDAGWIKRLYSEIEAIKSLVNAVITSNAELRSVGGGDTMAGVIATHPHGGTGEGGGTLTPTLLQLTKGTSANIDGNDEIVVPAAPWLYLTSAGATDNLDGIGAGVEGQIVFLTPAAGKDITLVHDGTVTAGKKLMINGEANVTLNQDHDLAIAIYDATATVWNVLVPGSGGGSYTDGDAILAVEGEATLDLTGAVTVAGLLTASAGATTPEVYNSAGDLKIQPDVQGDVLLFGDTDVGDDTSGRMFYVYRKAVEGDTYLRLFITAAQVARMQTDTDLLIQSGTGGYIRLESDNLYLDLGDNAGARSVRIRDSDNATVAEIDSNGNITLSGTLDGVDIAARDHAEAHGPGQHTEGNADNILYLDSSGDEQEVALGADATVLVSAGTTSAPVMEEIYTTHIAEFPALAEDLATGVMGGRPGMCVGESGEHGTFTAIRAKAVAGTAGTGTNTILIEADDNPAFSSATTLYTLPLDTSTEVEDTGLDNAWASGDIWIRARCTAVGGTAPKDAKAILFFKERAEAF